MAASVTGVPIATPSVAAATQRFLTLVYLVMAVGMAVTAAVSGSVSSNPEIVRRILFDPWFTWGLFFIQLALVAFLSAAVLRMAPAVAFLVFLAYAALTGVSLSAIFLFYSQETITSAFVVAAGMFLLSSLAGLLIRRDLSGGAQFVLMILLGWTFAYVISWFFPAGSLIGQTTTAVGILLFAGLTVWDTQRLKQLAAELAGRQGMGGMVVLGALTLYLDFINLFLLLLRAIEPLGPPAGAGWPASTSSPRRGDAERNRPRARGPQGGAPRARATSATSCAPGESDRRVEREEPAA